MNQTNNPNQKTDIDNINKLNQHINIKQLIASENNHYDISALIASYDSIAEGWLYCKNYSISDFKRDDFDTDNRQQKQSHNLYYNTYKNVAFDIIKILTRI